MEFKQIIEKAIAVKEKYSKLEVEKYGRNWTNEEIAMGLVTDVGELIENIQAKEGVRIKEDVDQNLKHELSDCLWAILVLANKYGVDLEKSFLETMDELDKRISKG